MPEVVVSLDEKTAEQLDVERELLGFDSRAEYLAWIVKNRAAIDKGTERERLLSAYEDRIEALERRLDELEVGDPARQPASEQPTADGSGTPQQQSSADPVAPGPGTEEPPGPADPEPAGTTTPDESAPERSAAPAEPAQSSAEHSEATAATDSTVTETDGFAGVDRIGKSTTVPGDDRQPTDAAADAGVESMHLSPERVSRVSQDTVAEDADVLSGVETDRLDELTRRAVAKTRKELDRDVETGLSYRSSTSLADDSVRPGDDITDLDALDLPGRSEETLDSRRAAAGHALAFLRDEGRARRSDFVDALYEECPAEYGTEDGWWNCIKQALKQVEAVDGGKGTRVWRFDG